ncbi:MAG: type II secretion system protein GspL [Burkholderiaceae bacterium]|jgi:general secretion pathway protein L
MSLLALLLPSRVRTPVGGEASAAGRTEPAAGWRFVFSRDGQTVAEEGDAPLAALPKADRLVLVAHDEDVAWLPVQLPKVSPQRLQEALRGSLEDRLLEEAADTHLALSQAGLRPGQTTWVAAVHQPWIRRILAQVHEAGLQASALVSLSEPGAHPQAHLKTKADGRSWAVLSGPQGVALWPLEWPGWKNQLPVAVDWTAEPSAARALVDQGIANHRLVAAAPRALQAALTHSNLLQFDLTPKMKGAHALLSAWASLKAPRWRALRYGLLALVLVHLVGLNVAAWQTRRELAQLQVQTEQLLRESFPSVKVVVDPVRQMERELATLRRASGQPGPEDLETWTDLLAGLWTGQPEPLSKLVWDRQGLRLEATPWPPSALSGIQDHARQRGWETRLEGNTLRLFRPGSPS